MNIGNLLNRRLGLITVPNLQKVVTNLLSTIGFVDDALPDSRPYKVYTAKVVVSASTVSDVTVQENSLGYELTVTASSNLITFAAPSPFSPDDDDKVYVSSNLLGNTPSTSFGFTVDTLSFSGPPGPFTKAVVGMYLNNTNVGTITALTSGTVLVEIRVYN